MSLMKGVKEEDCRWQWKGRQEWLCFSDKNSTKVQQAHLMERPGINIWDGSSVRELDFGNMRALPGRQPIRFQPPPLPLGKPPLKKNPPKQRETQYQLTQGMRDSDNVAIQPAGLRVLTHPCFVDLEKPRFNYYDGPENEHKAYIWQREIDLCEDAADLLTCLCGIYTSLLESGAYEFPALGTPSQTLSALALALHRAGAKPCEDRRFWYLSRSAAPAVKTKERDRDDLEATSSRPSTASAPSVASSFMRTGSLPALATGKTPPRCPENASAFITFRLENGRPCTDRDFALKMVKTWNDWKSAALENNCVEIPRVCRMERFNAEDFDRCEDQEDGDFEWLKMANEAETRVIRLGALCTTLWYSTVSARAKTIPKRVTLLSFSTRHSGGNTVSTGMAFKPNFRVSPGLTTIENTVLQTKIGKKAAAVLICNDEIMGGNFFNGYVNGIEEDFLMRSDLYNFFTEASFQAETRRIRDSHGHNVHVPEDGSLCCRDVRVFRDTYEEGYRPLKETITLPLVFCITLKNLNPHRDPSADRRIFIAKFDKKAYESMIKAKFDMVFTAAAEHNLDAICISDMGCDRLFIDGASFGTGLGKCLRRLRVKPPTIILSGSSKFISALKRTVNED